MEAKLVRERINLFYFDENGQQSKGQNPQMSGDCTGLSGDCSGLSGNCTGLSGDFDDCQLSNDERASKVNIEELVAKE